MWADRNGRGNQMNERPVTPTTLPKAAVPLSTIRASVELRSSCRYGGGGTTRIDVPDVMRVTEPAAPRLSSIRLLGKKEDTFVKSIWASLKV